MILKSAQSIFLIFITLNIFSQSDPSNTDWPQWRGPDRSGIWYEGPNLEKLAPGNITHVWEQSIGTGYSGPTLSGNRVYLMDYADGKEQVHCFNALNGDVIWTYTYPVSYNVGYPTGPRASVLVHGDLAYSFGTMGHLHCFDAGNGKIRWQVNGLEQYNSRIPIWGLASNPVIEEDKLIVQLGGSPGACLVAFDKNNGQELWRALDDEASYSAPILINQAGKRVLICWTGESISGLNPVNGRIYWSIPFQPRQMIMNVPNPTYEPPYLFLSGFFDGAFLLKLDQDSTNAELVYHRHGFNERETDALHCCISTPIIHGGYVYGVDSYGEVRCLDLLTGNRIWEELTLVPVKRWANIHFVRQGDKVWGFNEIGELLLGKFTPDRYIDLGRVKVIEPVKIFPNPRNGVCWAHPAFSRNRIFVRSDAKLVCLQVKYH